MEPVERVGLLVLQIALDDGDDPRVARLVVTTIDRLPPLGEPAEPVRHLITCTDDALAIVAAWLDRVARRPAGDG